MWELIRLNRRKSLLLFIGMGVTLVLLGYFIGLYINPQNGGIAGIVIALLITLILNLVSYYSGSKILLSISNAKEVTPDVHPRLYNVVEEMKVACQLPAMPKIYIINSEAPNAFATGRNPENAVIAVTAGLLARMNRDELQGVVAHETGHIVNRDIQFLTYAGIMLGVIVMISQVFTRSMFYGSMGRSRSDSSKGQGQIIILVIAILLAILAPIFAQLLYFAISRKREYLADATAARLTRYPEGLASALEKIASSTQDLETANKVTAPMYIVNPLKQKGRQVADLTSTHPPISERIRILRSMAGGASFRNYQEAFSSVKNTRQTIIPGSGMTDTTVIGLRTGLTGEETGLDRIHYERELGDIMKTVDQYRFIQCSCGLKIKIPPGYALQQVLCPRCGIRHNL
ncbi:MAG: M48 family metallopeptidase [Bacteroidales bacterium]|nr:M48 family metallopeptidase [Lentimicrobiaceae bacterium]MDD5694052.1 M48 family metallopeptidase [Bacteroidales bacterium]